MPASHEGIAIPRQRIVIVQDIVVPQNIVVPHNIVIPAKAGIQ